MLLPTRLRRVSSPDEKPETLLGFWRNVQAFFAAYGKNNIHVITGNGPGTAAIGVVRLLLTSVCN